MKWSSEGPDVPGKYWIRSGSKKEIVDVVGMKKALFVQMGNLGIPVLLFLGVEWAGPIEEPEEDDG